MIHRPSNRSAFKIFATFVIGGVAIAALACSSAPGSSPASTPLPPTQAPAAAPTAAPTQSSDPTTPSSGGSAEAIVIEIGDGSVARYIVGEQLADRDLPNDAIGETSDVSGTIAFNADGTIDPAQSKIEVNLLTLASDESRRDNFIKDNGLESNKFPTAGFVIQDAPGVPWPLPESGEASFQLAGNMTIREVTQPVTWDVTAQFGPDSVTGQSSATITFDQFDMTKPSLFFILSVDDEIVMELDFSASVS